MTLSSHDINSCRDGQAGSVSPILCWENVGRLADLMTVCRWSSKLSGYPNIPTHFGLRLPNKGRNHFLYIISAIIRI